MWNRCKISLSDAEHYVAILIDENHFQYDVQSESDIAEFIKSVITVYFFPCGLDRRKVYDIDNQKENLKEVGIIPNGWNCKLYFDSKNSLYWEDNFGKNSMQGLKISPYVNPLKKYNMKNN